MTTQIEPSPALTQQLADVKQAISSADIPTMKAALERSTALLERFALEAQKQRESAARAEVDSVIAKLSAGTDLRFGKEELEQYRSAYTDAKLATLSENANLATFATKMVSHLDVLAAKHAAAAPAGEKKPAKIVESGDKPTKADFDASSVEGDGRIAAAIDLYIVEKNLKGDSAYQVAFNAIARSLGASVAHAAPGFTGTDLSSIPEDED